MGRTQKVEFVVRMFYSWVLGSPGLPGSTDDQMKIPQWIKGFGRGLDLDGYLQPCDITVRSKRQENSKRWYHRSAWCSLVRSQLGWIHLGAVCLLCLTEPHHLLTLNFLYWSRCGFLRHVSLTWGPGTPTPATPASPYRGHTITQIRVWQL